MGFDPEKHHRRSIRLQSWDYGWAGAYFVTLCSERRICLFGDVVDGQAILSKAGQIVEREWEKSGEMRREIELDMYVIMPNHLHGLVFLNEVTSDEENQSSSSVGAEGSPPSEGRSKWGSHPKSLSSLMQGFKSASTKQINIWRDARGERVWQRNYYEHVVRDFDDLVRIREYIRDNPLKWAEDENHPMRWGA